MLQKNRTVTYNLEGIGLVPGISGPHGFQVDFRPDFKTRSRARRAYTGVRVDIPPARAPESLLFAARGRSGSSSDEDDYD